MRALQVTVATFAVATFLCALATAYWQLVVLKALQGLGFGAEWACGAVLMAEIIRPGARGRALGAVQSAWAVGWGAAVLLSAAILTEAPAWLGWRLLFAVGVLPALLILLLRRGIPEPLRTDGREAAEPFLVTLAAVFRPQVLRSTLVGSLFGVGAHGGYAALTTFLPTFLREVRHLSILGSSVYLGVIIAAFFCGCVASGIISDWLGRRINAACFAVACVVTVLVYIFAPLSNGQMLVLGFPLGFFSAGIPASMAALFSELYPSGIRGTGVGFCYNFGPGRFGGLSFPGRLAGRSPRARHRDRHHGNLRLWACPCSGDATAGNARCDPCRGFGGWGEIVGGSGVQISGVTMAEPTIDSHAHVFHRGLTLAAERRYTPGYDAPLRDYLEKLDCDGLSHGVLVQPSFLGTDNSYLLECLRRAPQRLRGVAVIDPASPHSDLPGLAEAGVVGIRLNLIGRAIPDFGGRDWRALLEMVGRFGWHVEVQRDASGLVAVLPRLLDVGVQVVVDHFGLPDPVAGACDLGFQRLLEFGRSQQVWVKLSAPYRWAATGSAWPTHLYPRLRGAFGLGRLMWGSDWPHTQFEAKHEFEHGYQSLTDLVGNGAEVAAVLASPRILFGF